MTLNSSTVFSDAIEVCSSTPAGASAPPREIQFSDPVIETSDVIAFFLELATNGKLTKWTNDFKSCETLCRAVAFMRKYDCEFLLSVLKLHARTELMMLKIAPLYVFMVAAAMDDVELSTMAFGYRYYLLPGADPVATHGIPGIGDPDALAAVLTLAPTSVATCLWPFELWT